jgi:hypothetical protein
MERHKRLAAAVVAAGLLLAACSADPANEASAEDIQPIEEPQPEAVEPESEPDPDPPDPDPEPEPEASEIDITVVPDEITEEYVEAVFVELETLYAEAVAELRRNDGELNIEVTDRLGEIFDNEFTLPTNLRIFNDAADAGFPNIREPERIGPRLRTVVSLFSADESCVYAETDLNSELLVVEAPVSDQKNYVELLPKTVERPVVLNRTPWVYGRVLVPADEADHITFTENNPCSD